MLSAREEIYICGKSKSKTEDMFKQLTSVSKMEDADLYHYDQTKPALGHGMVT